MMSWATRFALVVKFVSLLVKKLAVSNPEALAGRKMHALPFLGRGQSKPRSRSQTDGASQVGFHSRGTGATGGQPPLPEGQHRVAASLGAARRQLHSYWSLCFQPIPLVVFLFLAASLKSFLKTVPVYEEEGPSYKGKRGLKRQKREEAFCIPFLL